jgi:ribosomal protein S18 acetylase RimI-like enzyme
MNENDYQRFLDYAIANYAEEKTRAGNYAVEDAMQLSAREYQQLLPDGVDTHDNYLLSIINEHNQKAGFIWLALQQTGVLRTLTVVNILVYEQFRRRGYATQALRLAEEKARALGIERVTLQVFGHNTLAQSLYEKMGYRATNIYMAHDLSRDQAKIPVGAAGSSHTMGS